MSLLREYGIKEDKRFVQAKKEALKVLILVAVETIWVFGFSYWGSKEDPSNYTYIWGFPVWYFWTFLGAAILFPVVGMLLGIFTKDCDLEDKGTQKNESVT